MGRHRAHLSLQDGNQAGPELLNLSPAGVVVDRADTRVAADEVDRGRSVGARNLYLQGDRVALQVHPAALADK
jgi:hypothetical protein